MPIAGSSTNSPPACCASRNRSTTMLAPLHSLAASVRCRSRCSTSSASAPTSFACSIAFRAHAAVDDQRGARARTGRRSRQRIHQRGAAPGRRTAARPDDRSRRDDTDASDDSIAFSSPTPGRTRRGSWRAGSLASARAPPRTLLRWNNSHPPLVLQPTRGANLDLERTSGRARHSEHAGPVRRRDRREGEPAGPAAGVSTAAISIVQDPAQALVVRFADFPPGAMVYDACAAPGGKTLGLSRARESGDRRRSVASAAGARCAKTSSAPGTATNSVVVADAAHPPVRPVARLPARCALSRHRQLRAAPRCPTPRQHRGAASARRCSKRVLLDAAADRIAPGGVLCYATCSLEPEEDEMQVTAFLDRHPDFRRQAPPAISRRPAHAGR